RAHIMDAQRISDGKHVMLQAISKRKHPFEVEIARFFSYAPMSEDPRKYCVHILDVLQDPDDDEEIIVMPHLKALYRSIFDTVGEMVDCFRFEPDIDGEQDLKLMHQNFVAHRDCGMLNIVVDPSRLYPYGLHPVNEWINATNDGFAYSITRTECWPRYYRLWPFSAL
ncbi:hypothetical protein DFH09DRAFT_928562, partial [Mycena vulgaris]